MTIAVAPDCEAGGAGIEPSSFQPVNVGGVNVGDEGEGEDAGEGEGNDIVNESIGVGNGRRSRFNSVLSNADSVVSRRSSVGSVMSTGSDTSDVSGLFRGAPGLGAPDPSASPSSRRRSRRATAAIARRKAKGVGAKRIVFVPKAQVEPPGRFVFFSEIFKIKGTIVLKVVPQVFLAALMGLFANTVKLVYCGNGVASNEAGSFRNL
jgi:hypothetical protein